MSDRPRYYNRHPRPTPQGYSGHYSQWLNPTTMLIAEQHHPPPPPPPIRHPPRFTGPRRRQRGPRSTVSTATVLWVAAVIVAFELGVLAGVLWCDTHVTATAVPASAPVLIAPGGAP